MLHAGSIPGYPESHGCVHLPYAFAKALFDVTAPSTTVVIAAIRSILSRRTAAPGWLPAHDASGSAAFCWQHYHMMTRCSGAKYIGSPGLMSNAL